MGTAIEQVRNSLSIEEAWAFCDYFVHKMKLFTVVIMVVLLTMCAVQADKDVSMLHIVQPRSDAASDVAPI